MKAEAFKITGFSVVMGAVAFMLRWIQKISVFEEETGLAARGAGVNLVLAALIVVMAGILLFWCQRLHGSEAVRDYRALICPGVVFPILGIVAGALLGIAGLFLLVTAGRYGAPVLRRILALLEMLAGFSGVLMALHGGKPQQIKTRQIASVLLVLFGCMFMVTVYKENAANPVVWAFAPEILALCSATLALYFLAGYQYGEEKPYAAILFSFFSVFLCLMCVVDQGISADMIAFLALTLMMGLWGYAQVYNLKGAAPVTGVKQ